MGDLLFIIDEAGVIESATAATAAAFGYGTAELNGQPLTCVLAIPGRHSTDGTAPFWLHASQAPKLEGIHRDGRRFWLRLTQQQIHGSGQTHYVISLQDAAAKTPSGGIFSRHQDLYELATRQGRISVWEVDYRTNHLEFSPVLASLLGLSGAQIPTTVDGWKPRFHPEDWQVIERQTQLMLAGQLPEINAECRMLHVDGSIRWNLVRGQAYFDDAGNPVKTVGTSIDITDRKKVERERDVLFTMSLDLLCIADIRGYFVRVNPAFTRTLGYHEDELTRRPFFDFVHPEDLAATQKALAALTQGENLIAFENRYRCKDGTWVWLSWTCPGVVPGSDTVYAVARDVTEAKRVAAELQRAVKDAEQANRAKSEFLSRMSHELRTPLNAILGFGQLLQRDELSTRQRQQIDFIVKGGRHLLGLINEVLDITRIEVGQLDFSPEAVDVFELIQEVVGLAQPMAAARRIHMSVDEASLRRCFVLADRQRLKQVFLNLVSNAVKYNAEAGRVLIRGEAVSPERFGAKTSEVLETSEVYVERFRIAVEDTGAGIPPDKQDRLFTPFDRLGAEMTNVEGSGLGLVLSKRLAEIMGGILAVQSSPGKGTTVTVELVRHLGTPPARETGPAPAAPVAVTPVPTQTVLYIEDNLANVQLVEAVLAYRPGVRLLTALQGGIGLELARQHRPDLILLDVHLPDIRGDDLLGTIRGDPRLRPIPVVVLSADATSRQIDRFLDAGAKEYLTKPIDVEHFLRVLDRYLQRT